MYVWACVGCVGVYVYMCVYVWVYMWIYVYVYVGMYRHIYRGGCMYVGVYTRLDMQVHGFMSRYI